MSDHFISFENESLEFNRFLKSLKDEGLTTSEIIPKLLEKDGELFNITPVKKKDLEGFKGLIDFKAPTNDKKVILGKVNEFELCVKEKKDEDFIEYTSEWKTSDYSEEENKLLEKRVGYFGMLRHMLMHHKLDTFILPAKEAPSIITLHDLDFSDDFLDRLGCDMEEEFAVDISQVLFYFFFIFHPNEELPSSYAEAKRNLEELEILDELGETTLRLYKALDFIRKYSDTSVFQYENLKRFLNNEPFLPNQSKGYKSLVNKLDELMQTEHSKKKVCRIIEKENQRNNWVSEKEAFNILMEKFETSSPWDDTPMQRKVLDETIQKLGVTENPELIRKMLSILHEKRQTVFFWDEGFGANLKDLGIWGSLKKASNKEKWFSIIEFIKKNYGTPQYSFVNLSEYIRTKYKTQPETAFEKMYFKFIEELNEKQVPLKQQFKKILKANGDRFILPEYLVRFFRGMDKLKNLDEVRGRQDLGDIDYVFRMLGAEEGINTFYENFEAKRENMLEKMESELNPVLEKVQKRKLSSRAKQKAKKRKRRK